MNVMLDSGAGCSVIDLDTVKKMGLVPNANTISNLVDASGNHMNIVGAVDIEVSFGSLKYAVTQKFQVLDGQSANNNVLLG